MATPKKSSGVPGRKRPKGTTPEARENQLIELAYDLAEQQMIEGSASAMVITHWLKLAANKTKLEEEQLRKKNLLLQAQTEALASQAKVEELHGQILDAIRLYNGEQVVEDEEF